MEVKINPKTGMPEFVVEKRDIQDANEILKMTKTKGWLIFMDKLNLTREKFINAGKEGIKTRAKRDLSDIKWAILSGMDEYMRLAPRILELAEEFNKKTEEEKNGTNAEHVYTGE